MTISHILILAMFICLGSVGIASAQEGFVVIWRHVRRGFPIALRKTARPMRNMKII